MQECGISIVPDEALTRGQAAKLLYAISKLVKAAPGLKMFQ